jgi:hypothetical protein
MAEIGQATRRLLAGRAPWAIAGGCAALLPALWMWGFTVDDALIAVRYARHLAAGAGYRFNVGGPVTDGVTPLPWAFLLLPLARGAPLVVLSRAKVLGLAIWTVTAVGWGSAVGGLKASVWSKALAGALLALCVPLAAHGVSGMETPLATALATFAALSLEQPRLAALLAGLAAALRPELLPWALVVAVGSSLAARPVLPARTVAAGGLGVAPFAACALVRLAIFGRPGPLALLAKPSDLSHGVAYTLAASLASLAPIVAASPLALLRAPRGARVLVVAGAAHLLAVVAAGGDWMPYARLIAPIAPSLLYAFVLASPFAHWAWAGIRAGVAIALGAYLALTAAPPGRHVGRDRARLVEEARPWLGGAHRVATADIGWPTAATEADIVDLGGLTDPEIASLPGGHTSKRVDATFLLSHDPDVLLLYTDRLDVPVASWTSARFPRVVEARLASSELLASHFEARAFFSLGASGAGYFLLTRTMVDRPAPLR